MTVAQLDNPLRKGKEVPLESAAPAGPRPPGPGLHSQDIDSSSGDEGQARGKAAQGHEGLKPGPTTYERFLQ